MPSSPSNSNFKRKAMLVAVAFAVVVAAACGARSCSNSAVQQKTSEQQPEQAASSPLSDEQRDEVSSYGTSAAQLADVLAGHTWVSDSGDRWNIADGVASLSKEDGAQESKPLVIKSAELAGSGSAQTWKASVEVDGKASVLEAAKDGEGWRLACSGLAAGALTSTDSRDGLEVDPLPAPIADAVGEAKAAAIRQAIAERVSDKYPAATHASAPTEATLDFEAGTAAFSYTLDNKSSSKVAVKTTLTPEGEFEIDGSKR